MSSLEFLPEVKGVVAEELEGQHHETLWILTFPLEHGKLQCMLKLLTR
jgi:hypothetical protein